MKKNDDDDLIITNEIEPVPEDGLSVAAATGKGADSVTKDDTQKVDEESPTLREVLSNIHEDEAEKPQRLTLNKILVGDFFTSQILRRQLGVVLMIAGIILLYISNRYTCQRKMIEIDRLKQELQDAKYKALSTSSQLTEKSRQSNVLDMLKQCKDSSLHAADQAPYIIQVPEE